MNIKILTDTSCGIPVDECKTLGYEVMGLPFMLDDKEFDDLNIDKNDFYNLLKNAKKISTSQTSVDTVSKNFDRLLSECDHIIYLPITSGLSSAYNTGVMLANEKKYIGKVTCIDHRTISVLQRGMLEDVAMLIRKDVKPSKIKELIENNVRNSIWIVVDNLDYLKKGGRVSPVTAAIANILNIKPILFSDGGKFDVVKKERSIKNALLTMKSYIIRDLKEKFNSDRFDKFTFGVAYSECKEDGIQFKEELEDEYRNLGAKLVFDELPLVVECHTGMGVIGTALYKHIDEC